jgi:hypothetical protein
MSMNAQAIFFEFDQEKDALLALDTLEELGYSPKLHANMTKPTLHIHLDNQDLTSALEVAQAHGGRLAERQETSKEAETFALAYNFDLENSIRIPAHTVNEDWPVGYADELVQFAHDLIPSEEEAAFDPSADDYNHFTPGIHL